MRIASVGTAYSQALLFKITFIRFIDSYSYIEAREKSEIYAYTPSGQEEKEELSEGGKAAIAAYGVMSLSQNNAFQALTKIAVAIERAWHLLC